MIFGSRLFLRTAAGRVALAVLLLQACVAQAASVARGLPSGWTELIEQFDEIVAKDHIVGASIALVQDGRIVARHDYGFADLASGRRVDENTIFHWASITKTLNAIAVMQLRDRGLLSLQDSVTRYIPELRRVHNPFGSMDDITLAMLLDHSAGFQAPTWPYKAGKPWEPFEPTRWEQLVAMMPYQEIGFPPGSRFGYSNPTWIYLARILEELTGDPWEAYIHKNIFLPLGMQRSYFRSTPYHLKEHRSHNYSLEYGEGGRLVPKDHGADFDPGITVPNGGWNAPLADVATYIGFLTGATGGDAELGRRFETVLKRSTLEEMWQPRQSIAGATPSDGISDYMGLAFFIKGSGTQRVIGHTGGQANFSTMMYFNPLTRRGVVAAFNTSSPPVRDGKPTAFRTIQKRVIELLQ